MSYNGHKNYNHWNVSLWLLNDEGLYNMARDCIRLARTKDEAARDLLQMLPSHTPDGAPYSYSAVRAAITGEF